MKISPTKINTFRWCKRQYYYKYILKLPTIQTPQMERGVYVHELMSAYIRNAELPMHENEWILESGHQIFSNILKGWEDLGFKNGISEFEIWKREGEDEIGGIIDFFNNDVIVDFKAVDKLKEWRNPIQLSIYRFVIGRRYRYFYLQANETNYKILELTNRDMDFWEIEWRKTIDEIKEYEMKYFLADIPFPAKRTKYCKQYCSFYEQCNKKI